MKAWPTHGTDPENVGIISSDDIVSRASYYFKVARDNYGLWRLLIVVLLLLLLLFIVLIRLVLSLSNN